MGRQESISPPIQSLCQCQCQCQHFPQASLPVGRGSVQWSLTPPNHCPHKRLTPIYPTPPDASICNPSWVGTFMGTLFQTATPEGLSLSSDTGTHSAVSAHQLWLSHSWTGIHTDASLKLVWAPAMFIKGIWGRSAHLLGTSPDHAPLGLLVCRNAWWHLRGSFVVRLIILGYWNNGWLKLPLIVFVLRESLMIISPW